MQSTAPTAALPHTIFMAIRATAAWLAMPPAERFAFLGSTIMPILKKNPAVEMRFFDAEAYSARISDMVMWTTHDLAAYQEVVEDLRDTPFWHVYFEIMEIVPSIENAYQARRPAAA